MNRDLPPLLDNFKAFEGGGIDDGLTRLKDLPNGTKVKFGTYNSQTLVWRIAQDEGVTKAVLDLNYDTGKTVIGDMVPSSGSIAGNWAITGWLNATEAGGSWWANRVKYSDDPPETEPDYSSQDGFLHGWSETDRGLLQSIDWDCNDMGDFESYKLNSKLIIVANNEGLLAWNGEGFCASLGDSPVVTRTYHDPSAAYGGISGMGTSITEGTAYPNESIGIWPVCAPNPEAVVSDEPDDDGCYTISNKRSTVKDLQLGDKIKVAVNPEFQSEFGNYMVFEKVDQDHEGYPENSSTFMAKNITMVRAMEGIYVYNTAMDFSLTALSQYLNSDAGAGEWFQELIEGQVPPDGTDSSTLDPDYAYADKPGFFNVLDNNFTNKLLPTNIEHSTKKVYFFVPSVVEMGVKDQNNETWSSAETISSPFKWFDSDDKRTRALTSEVVSTYPDYKNELMAADESASYEANSPYYYTLRNMLNGNVFPIIRTDGTISPTNYVVGKGSCGICPVCNISNDLFLTLQEPDEDGCYIVDYTKIAVTIQADKMEESRAKELAGAVWVYGDHIPKNVNDGTKIQLTREEITRPDGEPYITLNDVPASDAEIETIINIKESDGELHPYLYLSNDYEGSGAALLLRKDIYQKGVWHNTGNIGVFNGSQFDVWCSNTFPTLLDTSISNILMEVDLPTKTTGAIRRKCFTLSNTEYGGSMYPAEGTALSYFKDNVRRQSMFNGGTVDYWTRSKYDVTQAYFIGLTGGLGQDMNTLSLGYRPAFCLPLTFKLKATPNENGSYDMYDEVSDISTFASSEFIVEKSVSWEQTKDFHVRQFTYNSKKQYQTMLEGATANIIYSEFPEEPTDYLNCAEIPNSTEYEIPENGWFRIDAIGGGGTGGTGINFDTASWGYAATCGGGGIGGHSRSEVALNKGDILKVVIDSGNVTVSCDSKRININALRGSDGNKPSGYTQGSGGLGGEANGGNIKNDRGQNGNSGHNTSNFGYNNVLNGGEEIQKIIQINRDISFTALGGKAVDYKRTLINSATITNNASLGSVAKVFISRGNTNIASPS